MPPGLLLTSAYTTGPPAGSLLQRMEVLEQGMEVLLRAVDSVMDTQQQILQRQRL